MSGFEENDWKALWSIQWAVKHHFSLNLSLQIGHLSIFSDNLLHDLHRFNFGSAMAYYVELSGLLSEGRIIYGEMIWILSLLKHAFGGDKRLFGPDRPGSISWSRLLILSV